MIQIIHYLTGDGRDLVNDWLRQLRDTRAKAQILRRMNRLEQGNFGDHKFCRDGVWELRIDLGPGYRVYYAKAGDSIVLLLGCGDKGSQDSDIEKAVELWRDWQRGSH